MQTLVILMLVVSTTFDFLARGDKWGRWAVLPSGSQYVAELLSVCAVLCVIALGTRNRFRFVRPAYWVVFGAIALHMVASSLSNAVEAGPVFAAIRSYLRAIPWFFLPAVYAFSEAQVRSQLRVLAAIAALQLPFAIQQTTSTIKKGAFTGDWTIGTLVGSPTLSIFVICSVLVAFGLFSRKQLRLASVAVMFLVFITPAFLNETKSTFVLLPIGLAVVVLAAARSGERIKSLSIAVGALSAMLLIGVQVYDSLRETREYAAPLKEYFLDPARLEQYLWKKEDIGTTKEVGRVDSLVVSARFLSSDPTQLAFGLGPGNVSDSALGRGFEGRHFRLLGAFAQTSGARFILEVGFVGLLLVYFLMWLTYQDAAVVARRPEGLVTGIAVGWTGVVAIMAVSMFYTLLVAQTSLSYLFWYFSGLIAADRMRTSMRATA